MQYQLAEILRETPKTEGYSVHELLPQTLLVMHTLGILLPRSSLNAAHSAVCVCVCVCVSDRPLKKKERSYLLLVGLLCYRHTALPPGCARRGR